mmetsp:Transcript_2632/g.3947  ORF Transcript_2632/g.3947 Transcript_2632/m.3947 type:complete len:342 (-) Transcript_2632:61-1086(-)|eukprot:CAMPEP_0185029260 /NCGR_PEP_ID=MMETSP1103-20130426/15457_1 /TAXON_ID=36769 /ORGANISM="Paraphysomonas bandaiensis, Strain Caron Lab Isolate" /LENGTH=341 /DNA_ID=CAMNT_0027563931 /DNA_START=27 /DNA_END=1052 /DNA_ORIENTATION=+
MGKWRGETELQNALEELTLQRPPGASKVKYAASVALRCAAEYKMAVFAIEKFIRKTPPAFRIAGLYVIDSICRDSKGKYKKEKQLFISRFALKMKDTLRYLRRVPEEDNESMDRVLHEWRKRGLFLGALELELGDAISSPDKDLFESNKKAEEEVLEGNIPEDPISVNTDSGGDAGDEDQIETVDDSSDLRESSYTGGMKPRLLKRLYSSGASSSSLNILPTESDCDRPCMLYREGLCPLGSRCRYNHVRTEEGAVKHSNHPQTETSAPSRKRSHWRMSCGLPADPNWSIFEPPGDHMKSIFQPAGIGLECVPESCAVLPMQIFLKLFDQETDGAVVKRQV